MTLYRLETDEITMEVSVNPLLSLQRKNYQEPREQKKSGDE